MIRCHLKGRLGNVMFEIASCYAYARDHGQQFTVSNTTKDPVMQPLYFQNLVNPRWDDNKPARWIREMQHNYQLLPWQDDWVQYNIEMMGFWQTEKYFKHRRAEIQQLFNIPDLNIDAVSIHIRRGDYLTIPGKHINPSDEYFRPAIRYFNEQCGYENFHVFSDDIEWCKAYFKDYEMNFVYHDSNDPLTDMSLMASCKHHINSSSTFSWWGAWLYPRDGSVVITPREWFQSIQPENTSDITPENWIKL